MKDFVYNKGGTAIIRPLHFHDVKGFLLRIIRIMRGIYKEEAMSKNLEKTETIYNCYAATEYYR